MPFIRVSTTQTFDEAKRTELSQNIAECIRLLPDKPPERSMVQIEVGCNIYRGGVKAECAFVETLFQKPLSTESQKEYIEAMYALFQKELGLTPKQIYFAMVDLDVWGSNGTLR